MGCDEAPLIDAPCCFFWNWTAFKYAYTSLPVCNGLTCLSLWCSQKYINSWSATLPLEVTSTYHLRGLTWHKGGLGTFSSAGADILIDLIICTSSNIFGKNAWFCMEFYTPLPPHFTLLRKVLTYLCALWRKLLTSSQCADKEFLWGDFCKSIIHSSI